MLTSLQVHNIRMQHIQQSYVVLLRLPVCILVSQWQHKDTVLAEEANLQVIKVAAAHAVDSPQHTNFGTNCQ